MTNLLIIAQIVVSVLLIIAILFQQRGTALGSAFGQEGGSYGTRRGFQKKLFWATIVLATLFALLAFLNLFF
jgi:preprotein translocase subunit SecG